MNPTDLICLEIVKGIPAAPNDPYTAEAVADSISLLDPDGLMLEINGWSLAIPGIKRGGTWMESQTTDGRTLVSGVLGNVTEKMDIVIGNTDPMQRFALWAKLLRLADDAREFWSGTAQMEPVYLKMKAVCAHAYQYALIYTLQAAQESDPFDTNPWKITFSIEREEAWRIQVPPGGNPLEYWFWKQRKTRGVDYDVDDMNLVANTNHFRYETLNNRFEWNGASRTAYLSHNWVDIDGDTIPGDAPALVYMALGGDSLGQPNQIYVSLDTVRRDWTARLTGSPPAQTMLQRNVLACADEISGTTTPTIDACGVYCRNQSVNRYIATYTVAAGPAAVFTEVLRWTPLPASFPLPLAVNMFQGTWAAYLRCAQVSGALGDVEVRLRVNQGQTGGYDINEYLLPNFMPLQLGTTSCIDFDICYLGTFTYPLSGHPDASGLGSGLDVQGNSSDLAEFAVQVRNRIASTRALEFLDLWFMPVDEAACIWNRDNLEHTYGSSVGTHVLDNTGYSTHGQPDGIALEYASTAAPFASALVELTGTIPQLKPHQNNRLYILVREATAAGHYSRMESTPVVRINIVPRCYGIADVEPDA